VDERLADFLSACLAEKPADRPKDFGEVLARLDRLGANRVRKFEALLDALPADTEPVLEAVAADDEVLEAEPASLAAGAEASRTHTDCTVKFGGHEIRVECSVWTNVARVRHDGVVMASGWPLIEATYPFVVLEGGQMVQYSVVIRGPGLSPLVKPYFTVTRNGVVLYNDR
jgi:hypothetical protein